MRRQYEDQIKNKDQIHGKEMQALRDQLERAQVRSSISAQERELLASAKKYAEERTGMVQEMMTYRAEIYEAKKEIDTYKQNPKVNKFR